MAGNQSRGLIAASKTRGWDPTIIPARGDQPARSITDFDVDQGNLAGKPVGSLPDGPFIGWPDGAGAGGAAGDASAINAQGQDFESP